MEFKMEPNKSFKLSDEGYKLLSESSKNCNHESLEETLSIAINFLFEASKVNKVFFEVIENDLVSLKQAVIKK